MTKKGARLYSSDAGDVSENAIFIYKRTASVDWLFCFSSCRAYILFSLDIGLVGISIWYVNMIMIVAFFIFYYGGIQRKLVN
ncbi:hypothetical protein LSPH24S_04823 [Lysinibacillus sphaericus]